MNGTISSVSITEEPNELYLVVSSNERTIALPKGRKGSEANLLDPGLDCVGEPYMVDDSYEYILLTNYYDAQNDCIIESIPNTSGGVEAVHQTQIVQETMILTKMRSQKLNSRIFKPTDRQKMVGSMDGLN